jgi:hypothetical protein
MNYEVRFDLCIVYSFYFPATCRLLSSCLPLKKTIHLSSILLRWPAFGSVKYGWAELFH